MNLTTTPLSAYYTNTNNFIGSMNQNALTSYQSEGEGSNTVIFNSNGTTVASDNGVFQFGNFYTIVAYTGTNGPAAFGVTDNNIAIDNGQSQIRAIDANTGTSAALVDVYLQAGSTSSPTLTQPNLISGASGLAFGAASAYDELNPGQYTMTVTQHGSTSTILLMTTVSVTGGQSMSVYALAGATSLTTTDDEGG